MTKMLSRRPCLGALAGAALGLAALAPAQADTVSLKLSVETPQGDPLNVMLRAFASELEKRAGDQVSIEIFDGGVLGDEIAQMELVRAGEVDVVPMGSDVVELDKHFAIFDMPFLFPDAASAHRALDGELGDSLADSLREATGLEVLAFGELGFRVISNNKRPINTPADLEGLKLRTPGSKTRLMAFEMLGASPTPMNLGEVYLALKQGALDGQENPLSVIKEFSFHEVQKHISITRHVYTPITLTVNGDTWASLSPELQQAMREAAHAAAQATRELAAESDARLVSEFEAAGVMVNEADVAAFKAVTGPIYDAIGEVAGPEFVNKVLAILDRG